MDFELDPEAKRQWIEALRDPERKQARGFLNNGTGMCCLGVACDISEVGGWQDHSFDGNVWYNPGIGWGHEDKGLPNPVAKWLGVPTDPNYRPENPRVPGLLVKNDYETGLDSDVSLAQLNDSGFTFAQIADVIEYFM